MKRKLFKLITIGIICLGSVMQSCREDSTLSMPYSLDYAKANASLEGQFEAIWTGMNCNYPIWDYEEEHGLNWDDVYDKYIQRFRELDQRYDKQNPVPDSIIVALYREMFAPLHDGHLYVDIKNIHTEKIVYELICPSYSRLKSKYVNTSDAMLEYEYLEDFTPTLKYYVDSGEIGEWDEEYDYIYAKFKDGILYFRVPEFRLSKIFEERKTDEKCEKVYQMWYSWFKNVQDLHQKNLLKGIVIDLRNNLGGHGNDFQYILGALFEGNEFINGRKCLRVGYQRQKSGIARLDYSSIRPFYLLTYEGEHVSVEAPIVVLANEFSISTSEIVCLATKQLKNGYVIGTRTYGGFSPSIADSNKLSFVGDVGNKALSDREVNSAPFYIKIPDAAFLSIEKKILEGYGVEPDETVQLDWQSHLSEGKDNQLDRALDYIRSKQNNI